MSFTYIIRSINKENATDYTNSCSIRLMGLPQQYKRYKATVVGFYLSTYGVVSSTSIYDLRADSLAVGGMADSNRTYGSIAFANNNNTFPQGEYSFEMENVNGRSIRFQIYNENNLLIKDTNDTTIGNTTKEYNKNWILVLSLVGIEESPNSSNHI